MAQETPREITLEREHRGNLLFRSITLIERLGNLLPHPFWLFWILTAILAVVSSILQAGDVAVTLPESNEHVVVKSLLSVDGLRYAAESALENFSSFPALTVIVVMLLGVSVAERSGLLEAILRATVVKLPGRWTTFTIAFSGMIAHIMSDSAYLAMIPLGALAFRAARRSPVLGVVVAYVSVSAGFNASPLITPSDAIRASLTTAAAQIVDPNYVVTPAAMYFFSAASSLVLAALITFIVEFFLARRKEFAVETGEGDGTEASPTSLHLSKPEKRGLACAALTSAVYIAGLVILMATPTSPLRGPGGSIVQSVVIANIAVFSALLLVLTGMVFGVVTGSLKTAADVPTMMAQGVSGLAPVIVLFFAVSQFLAYFKWTGIASVLPVRGGAALHTLAAPHLVILLIIILAVSILNMLITSGSAMWSILAPILIPMIMYVGCRQNQR